MFVELEPRYCRRVQRIARVEWARIADVTLALGLLVPSLVEVWISPLFSDDLHGPRWLNTLFLAGASLPMLWRRTRPEAAFGVFAASWTIYLLALYPRQVDAPGTTWFMMLLAWFSFGLYGRGRKAAVVGSLGAVGFLAVLTRQLGAGITPSDVLPN